MIEFLNKLINADFATVTGQEVADWFNEILGKLFDYVENVMGI